MTSFRGVRGRASSSFLGDGLAESKTQIDPWPFVYASNDSLRWCSRFQTPDRKTATCRSASALASGWQPPYRSAHGSGTRVYTNHSVCSTTQRCANFIDHGPECTVVLIVTVQNNPLFHRHAKKRKPCCDANRKLYRQGALAKPAFAAQNVNARLREKTLHQFDLFFRRRGRVMREDRFGLTTPFVVWIALLSICAGLDRRHFFLLEFLDSQTKKSLSSAKLFRSFATRRLLRSRT